MHTCNFGTSKVREFVEKLMQQEMMDLHVKQRRCDVQTADFITKFRNDKEFRQSLFKRQYNIGGIDAMQNSFLIRGIKSHVFHFDETPLNDVEKHTTSIAPRGIKRVNRGQTNNIHGQHAMTLMLCFDGNGTANRLGVVVKKNAEVTPLQTKVAHDGGVDVWIQTDS